MKHIQEFVVTKAGLWHVYAFCNILDRISNFVYVNEKFCNKNLFLDLFSIVLIKFSDFTACRIFKKTIVLHEMH